MTEEKSAASSDNQTLADRGNNRSRQPANSAFREFIGSNWGPRPENTQGRNAVSYTHLTLPTKRIV